MPDIAKCTGVSGDGKETCPKREQCYRYMVPPSKYQSYFAGLGESSLTDECRWFIPDVGLANVTSAPHPTNGS